MTRVDPPQHDHSPVEIARRLARGPKPSYLRDWVYGGIDGAVTTFAVVSGVTGAELPATALFVIGFANIVADGFSMAASNYIGTRTEAEELRYWDAYERRQIGHEPAGEREEVRQILIRKGFAGDILEKAVTMLTKDHDVWVRMMLTEEYGLPLSVRSPFRAGLATYLAFMVCGLVPLLPFLAGFPHPFLWAAAFTGTVFVSIGSLKSRWSIVPWWSSGLSTFAIGAAASALAYAVGLAFRPIT